MPFNRLFLTRYLMKLQTHGAQAMELARAALVANSWKWAERHLHEIQQVTPQQIQAAMVKYCKNPQFVFLGQVKMGGSAVR